MVVEMARGDRRFVASTGLTKMLPARGKICLSSFVYNGDGVRTRGEGNWGLTWRYGLDLISATDGTGVQTYVLYDGSGSVTDGDGDVTASYGYDVFGALRSGSPGATEWLFTGEQRDSESGLYYLRARYYDTAIGRFLSQDPITAVNLYAYVRNNPLRFMHRTGQWPKISVPNPVNEVKKQVEQVKEQIVDPVVDTVKDGAGEASDFFTETLPKAAECTWEQTAKAGEWLYRKAIVPTINFLAGCEGGLLAGGTLMVGVGGAMVVGGLWTSGALVAGAGLHGLEGAVVANTMTYGGGLLVGLGGYALLDACLHTDIRFSIRQAHGQTGGAPKE
jgi:RHS repeat-associated protein